MKEVSSTTREGREKEGLLVTDMQFIGGMVLPESDFGDKRFDRAKIESTQVCDTYKTTIIGILEDDAVEEKRELRAPRTDITKENARKTHYEFINNLKEEYFSKD